MSRVLNHMNFRYLKVFVVLDIGDTVFHASNATREIRSQKPAYDIPLPQLLKPPGLKKTQELPYL